jgi:lipoprotein NlpI
LILGAALLSPGAARGQTAAELLKQATAALSKGKSEEALALLDKAIAAGPNYADAYFLRGSVHSTLRRHENAVDDYSKVIKLEPQFAEPFQRRGAEYFRLGKFAESIQDFDAYIAKKPDFKPQHWQRGISYYYAGRYKDGKEQFEGYQTFDDADVENAVWRYLCMVPLVGKEKARADMLKVGEDKRVPMRQIYDLFAGKLQPADVLAAAKVGKPDKAQLNSRLFYAHLYLGLWHASEGDAKKALAHLNTATEDHPIGHYMWDVARVHRDLLRKKLGKSAS